VRKNIIPSMWCSLHPKFLGQVRWGSNVGNESSSLDSHAGCPSSRSQHLGGKDLTILCAQQLWGTDFLICVLLHEREYDLAYDSDDKTSQRRRGLMAVQRLVYCPWFVEGNRAWNRKVLFSHMPLSDLGGRGSSENYWLDANSHSFLCLLFIIRISFKG
jgi:hypothetical protein